MKTLLASLLCAACLLLAGASQAAVQEFGPGFSRFTIDVPEGWTAKAIDGGVQLADQDGTCSLSVTNVKSGGASAEALCKAIVLKSGMQDAKELGKEDGNYAMSGTRDGVPLVVSVTVEGELAAVIVMGGDIGKASGPLDSLQ
jgi:hypothetical protein